MPDQSAMGLSWIVLAPLAAYQSVGAAVKIDG